MPRILPGLQAALAISLAAASPAAALANNYGESLAWRFASPSDLAAQIAARDLIERRRGGVFAAPIYNTHVERQYNCGISATATGNSGVQNAVANSPSVTGATAAANGNSNTSSVAGYGAAPGPGITSGQVNGGPVSATLVGATTTAINGSPSQTLNSEQANSGNQYASVSGANACAFGALN